MGNIQPRDKIDGLLVLVPFEKFLHVVKLKALLVVVVLWVEADSLHVVDSVDIAVVSSP